MFQEVRRAQYHETDQMGVIHHAAYVKWMEEARVAYLDRLGYGYVEIERDGVVCPVIGISIDYKRPVAFFDEVEVEVRVEAYNGRVLELGYTMRNRTKGTLCTRATSRHCFLKDGRTVSLRQALPKLDALLTRELEQTEERTEDDANV